MASQLQLRRGTTAQHAVFTGAPGEVTVDTDKKVPVVHDGATPGGFPIEGLKDKPAGGELAGTYPNPTIAPVTATGSSAARTLATRFSDAVNVKDFGAAGNNVADDGPAIRAAIAHAINNDKAVYFPGGTYLISTTTTGATSIPTGSAAAVQVTNASAVTKDLILFGDGAKIVSPLYPQTYAQPPFQQFVFFLVQGNFNIGVYNLDTASTSPPPQSQATKGRTYSFYLQASGGFRPPKAVFRDCNFRDFVLSLRVDATDHLNVDSCSFIYTYGFASTGGADWACGIGSRAVKFLECINCYFDGHEAADSTGISANPSFNNNPADGLILAAGSLTDEAPRIVISNNYVRNFSREGIYVLGASQNSLPTSTFETGSVISNNILDGNYHFPTAQAKTNWAIRNDNPNTIIANNVIRHATVGILNIGSSTGAGGIPGAGANYCLIANNHIELCPFSRVGYVGATGISVAAPGTIVEGNQIIGKDVGSYRQNGWTGQPSPSQTVASTDIANDTITITGNPFSDDDTISFLNPPGGTGVTGVQYYVTQVNGDTFGLSLTRGGSLVDITGSLNGVTVRYGRLEVTRAISCAAFGTTYIRNNHCAIISKNSSSVLTFFLDIDAGNGNAYIENNIISGFDFMVYRFGGNDLRSLWSKNKIDGCTRLSGGYIGLSYGAPIVKDHIFTIYPTQTGWYQMPLYGSRFGMSFDLEIEPVGEIRYGDTTTSANNGTQSTKLSLFAYTDETGGSGSTNSRLVLRQSHAGISSAVTKAYARHYLGGLLFYVYVDKVWTKAALTFSGGGGSGAAGYATISGGVVQSVTITNGGSGYTSAPTVSITNLLNSIKGSGATFTASLLADAVDSVAVGGSGGSGYSQPINFHFVADNVEDYGIATDFPVYDGTTPSSGMEMVFSTGTKTMTLTGGSGGTITGTGSPVTGTALSATGVAATDLITATGHPFANGDRVGFQSLTGGSGLTAGTTYFVRDAVGNDFKLAATSGGAAIDFTTDITAATIIPAMPEYIGQHFIDSSNNKVYVATGTAGGKWALLN